MARRIDQFFGAMTLQHHDPARGVNDRSAMWAHRLGEQGPDGRWTSAEGSLGDVLIHTLWPANSSKRPTTGGGGGSRELPAWAAAWPVVCIGIDKRDKPKGAPVVTGDDGKDDFVTAAPIRRDDYEDDPRFQAQGHKWPDWRTPYPTGYLGVSMGATIETEQQRLLLSGDDSIIAPNHMGPGVMGTLIHDLEPEATMTQGSPPGRAGRAARFQTLGRVVRFEEFDYLDGDLLETHNAVAWNLAPTGADWEREGERGRGFAGLGTVIGRTSSPPRKNDTTGGRGDPVITEPHAGPGGSGVAQGIGAFPSGGRARTDQSEPPAAGAGPLAVAFADWTAAGPFIVGHGDHDKHRHGTTLDRQRIHPLHIQTEAYFADPHDAERDAPLEFDRADYTGGHPQAIVTPVWLRYSKLDSHVFMGERRGGLYRWETTVPYLESGPPRDTPPPRIPGDRTPPPGGPPGSPTVPAGPPTTGRVEPPASPIDPEVPGMRVPFDAWPGPTGDPYFDPEQPDPFGTSRGGRGQPGAPVQPEGAEGPPVDGSGGGAAPGPTEGHPGAPGRPDQDETGKELGEPPFVELEDGTVVPFNPWNGEHRDRWRDGFGRQTPTGGAEQTQQYGHDSRGAESHLMHPRAEGFASLLMRPQLTTGAGLDFRVPGATADQIREDDRRRPTVMRVEAFGHESDGEWIHTQEPGSSRYRGGTGKGGVAFMPPEVDMGDDGDSFAPSGVSASDAYAVFVPGAYLGFGYPDPASGEVANCGYRVGYNATAESIVIAGKTGDAWTQVVGIGKNYVNMTTADYMTAPSGADADRPGSPVAGTVMWNTDSTALEVYDGSSWVELGAGGSGSPALRVVEDHTAGDNLTVAEHDSVHTNTGATGDIKLVLPNAESAAIGCVLTFVLGAAQLFEVEVSDTGGETIQQAGSSGTKLSTSTLGRVITVELLSSTKWYVTETVGAWTLA